MGGGVGVGAGAGVGVVGYGNNLLLVPVGVGESMSFQGALLVSSILITTCTNYTFNYDAIMP